MDEVLLFAKEDAGQYCEAAAEERKAAWSDKVQQYLKENNITLFPYQDFYRYVSEIHEKKVLLCKTRVSSRLSRELSEDVLVIDRPNPTSLMKAVKNQTEMENLRKAHLKDGIAVTRFMYWLKKCGETAYHRSQCSAEDRSIA